MRLHHTTVNELIRLFTTYGGYTNEKKLRQVLATLNLSAYTQQSGESVIVPTKDFEKAINNM